MRCKSTWKCSIRHKSNFAIIKAWINEMLTTTRYFHIPGKHPWDSMHFVSLDKKTWLNCSPTWTKSAGTLDSLLSTCVTPTECKKCSNAFYPHLRKMPSKMLARSPPFLFPNRVKCRKRPCNQKHTIAAISIAPFKWHSRMSLMAFAYLECSA